MVIAMHSHLLSGVPESTPPIGLQPRRRKWFITEPR
jgi:hypothetical protein